MVQKINGVNIQTSNDTNLDIKRELLDKMVMFVEECKKVGINVIITQGYRSIEYQNGLYATGRTKPGKVVTNCKGGQSPHNYKEAFDFAPLEKNGSINWNTVLNPKWKQCGKIAQSIGLEWGGAWKSFVDMPHCEIPGASTRANARFNALNRGKEHIPSPDKMNLYTNIENVYGELWGTKK